MYNKGSLGSVLVVPHKEKILLNWRLDRVLDHLGVAKRSCKRGNCRLNQYRSVQPASYIEPDSARRVHLDRETPS